MKEIMKEIMSKSWNPKESKGNYDKLESTYWDSSVLKFKKKSDERKIYNLRCFFSLLTQHPLLFWVIRPLLNLPFRKLFWSIGNILDGYYTRKGMAYKLKPKEFIISAIQYLTKYRNSRKLSKDNTNRWEQKNFKNKVHSTIYQQ